VDPTPEDAERIGTLGSVFSGGQEHELPEIPDMPEIEIDPQPVYVPMPTPTTRMVQIRMGPEPVEQMSWTGAGRTEVYNLAAHQRYVVPDYIAEELVRIDKLR
jgi:hypothetical protein